MGRFQRDGGFSLVEVMSSMVIFTIITLSLAPVMALSLKSTNTGRLGTVGKELSQNSVERLEGTTWYVSYDAKPNKRVDLLDLYYPSAGNGPFLAGESYSSTTNSPLTGTGGVYQTVCTTGTANPACPTSLPANYTVTFKASFVKANGTTPETYQIVSPPATYSWNTQGADTPPADLMDMTVTSSWTIAGKTSTYTLRTLLSNRHFAPSSAVDATASASPTQSTAGAAAPGQLKIQGRATLDYVLQANTGFKVTTGTGCTTSVPCYSDMTATFGQSESRIETQEQSTASQTQTVGDLELVRTYPSPQTPPSTPPPDLAHTTTGAITKQAPPASTTVDVATAPANYLYHPDLASAAEAMVYGGENKNVKVDVSNELPIAEGFFQTTGTTSGLQEGMFTNSQIDYTNMKLDATQPLDYFLRITGGPLTQLGTSTTADTYALGTASRSVETKVHAGFPALQGPRIVPSNKASWNMFTLSYFDVNVDCKSTANPATALATAGWTAMLGYYYDPSNNGTIPNSPTNGSITLSSSGNDVYNGVSVPNAIASLKAANPLEYDGGTAATDIYMFEERDASGNITKHGYISDWTENKTPYTSVSADGRTTAAGWDAAMRIQYASLNSLIPETATSVSMGKMSCSAIDNR